MTVNEAGRLGGAERQPEVIENGGTARLHLTLATTDYDHVRDLMNGVLILDLRAGRIADRQRRPLRGLEDAPSGE